MALIVVFHVHILLLKMVLWKRHHRHVVETGLALLTHSSVHANFWFHAFETGTYLINRLPSRTNDNIPPFQKLFCHVPDYKILKVLGVFASHFFVPIIIISLNFGPHHAFLLDIIRHTMGTIVLTLAQTHLHYTSRTVWGAHLSLFRPLYSRTSTSSYRSTQTAMGLVS